MLGGVYGSVPSGVIGTTDREICAWKETANLKSTECAKKQLGTGVDSFHSQLSQFAVPVGQDGAPASTQPRVVSLLSKSRLMPFPSCQSVCVTPYQILNA
jgi:hypothetical protein